MAKTQRILFKLEEVTVDRTQYKPYNHKLVGQDVFVALDIPADEAEVGKNGEVIITLGGLSSVLSMVADAVDEVQQDYVNKFKGGR